MVKYYVIFTLMILLCVFYSLIYYRRFNISLTDNYKKIYRISPKRFTIYILIATLILGFGFSIYDVYRYERNIMLVEEYTVENRYLKDGTLSSNVEYVFTEYNLYFGGTYFEDDRTVICIRDDSPQDLVSYLENRNIPFEYVEYNYSELLILKQLIIRNSKDTKNIIGVAVDEKTNKVVIYTDDLDEINSRYQNYINEGVLVVKESANLVEK